MSCNEQTKFLNKQKSHKITYHKAKMKIESLQFCKCKDINSTMLF